MAASLTRSFLSSPPSPSLTRSFLPSPLPSLILSFFLSSLPSPPSLLLSPLFSPYSSLTHSLLLSFLFSPFSSFTYFLSSLLSLFFPHPLLPSHFPLLLFSPSFPLFFPYSLLPFFSHSLPPPPLSFPLFIVHPLPPTSLILSFPISSCLSFFLPSLMQYLPYPQSLSLTVLPSLLLVSLSFLPPFSVLLALLYPLPPSSSPPSSLSPLFLPAFLPPSVLSFLRPLYRHSFLPFLSNSVADCICPCFTALVHSLPPSRTIAPWAPTNAEMKHLRHPTRPVRRDRVIIK